MSDRAIPLSNGARHANETAPSLPQCLLGSESRGVRHRTEFGYRVEVFSEREGEL